MTTSTTALRRIGEQVACDALIPFLGAGFSYPSGFPSWRELTDSLTTVLADDSSAAVTDLRARLSEPDLAELLDSFVLSDHQLRQHLIDRLDSTRVRPHPYHRAIISLGCSIIVTTNWDNLLEAAHREAQIPYHVIYRDEDISLFDPARRVQILKIHGTIDDLQSLVFRKSQYEVYWRERPLLTALLTTLAATKSFLFLGYGLGDPNITSQLAKIRDWSNRAGRVHYSLVYGPGGIASHWRTYGIECVSAERFRSDEGNYEEATQDWLAGLLAASRRATMSNLDRSKLVNQELTRLIVRGTPQTVLRMRGALGWLSNPPADENDPIYGDYAQDLEERHMSELVCECLDKLRGSRAHNILHLNAAPLLGMYRPSHLLRRFSTMRSLLIRYKSRIMIVQDELPSTLNHMIIDDLTSVFGYKHAGKAGIPRVVSTRDRVKIADEISQFDRDAETLAASNKTAARRLGIDVERDDWNHEYILTLIDRQIWILESMLPPASTMQVLERTLGPAEYADALVFSILKHSEQGQTREDNRTPFGVHLVRVSEWLRDIGKLDTVEIHVAAALHDVIEDCNVEVDEIAAKWGSRVANLVAELSQGSEMPFQEYLQQVRDASVEAKAIKLADRFDNVRDLEHIQPLTFGGISPAQYLFQSGEILTACRSSNLTLALALQEQIETVWRSLDLAKQRQTTGNAS